ncbi:MAG TPA: BON domain-containing protein [Thermomicrobiaceae bacterium]|nr:BON domain-containing protein [Thermomicrobiaceae bacterium]
MTSREDAQLAQRVQLLCGQAGMPLDVEVHDGVARLVGLVTSPAMRQAAIDLALLVPGIQQVDDDLDYEITAPDTAYEAPDEDQAFGFADVGAFQDDVSDVEPDFVGRVGAAAGSFQEALEEGEPYFPPTDPVVRPSRVAQELRMVGGFQDTSMDELATRADVEPGQEPGELDQYRYRDDEDIRDDVIRELHEDALTADLELHVSVLSGEVFLRGEVPTLDVAENAEAVAARVPGVAEVADLTEIMW